MPASHTVAPDLLPAISSPAGWCRSTRRSPS